MQNMLITAFYQAPINSVVCCREFLGLKVPAEGGHQANFQFRVSKFSAILIGKSVVLNFSYSRNECLLKMMCAFEVFYGNQLEVCTLTRIGKDPWVFLILTTLGKLFLCYRETNHLNTAFHPSFVLLLAFVVLF